MVQSGVQRAFGASLRQFLGHKLGNRFSAFGAGLAVTAVLQSSTATALMVSGFAAEGLVGLAPGLAIMLGANVGTTLIVQLLSFDVSVIAPASVLLGYLLFRRARTGLRDFGRVMIGLGLILLALHEFLAVLELLTSGDLAQSLLASLSGHIFAIVLLGMVLTWASHSSVAIVLLAMSLATSGVLPISAGLALALGANLGTAINPVLESARKDPASLRLPLGSLLMRAVGAVVVLALFPTVQAGILRLEPSPARAIADFHMIFNLALAVIFLPILRPFADVLTRWLPATPDAELAGAPRYLEDIGPRTPVGVALGGATREALRLAEVLEQMLTGLHQAFQKSDRVLIEDTKRLDDELDHLTRAIKENLLSIDPEKLDDVSDRQLTRILAFSINIEQAGDLVDRGLLGVASRRIKRGVVFASEDVSDLTTQIHRLKSTLRLSTTVFLTGDLDAARSLAQEKESFRELEERATASHLHRLRSGAVQAVEASALHLDALRDLKRINGHLVEASAYPILKHSGELLPTRLRSVS